MKNNFKKPVDKRWIFVFEPEVLNFIDGDSTVLESTPLSKLTKKENLTAFKHEGFWQCMDTMKDKNF